MVLNWLWCSRDLISWSGWERFPAWITCNFSLLLKRSRYSALPLTSKLSFYLPVLLVDYKSDSKQETQNGLRQELVGEAVTLAVVMETLFI